MEPQSVQRVGVIGHPLPHTLSPAMHTAAFEELHLPFLYGVFDVVDDFLPSLVASLRMIGFAGANVTIPYKERIMPLLDRADEDARTIGAVNTIVSRNGRLEGYNTDVAGIQKSLEPFKDRFQNLPVVILGAGGGARAAAYALSKHFSPASVRFYNRTPERAERLAEQFREDFSGPGD